MNLNAPIRPQRPPKNTSSTDLDTENESLQEQVEDLKILIGSIVEERKQLKDQLTELQKRVDTMRA